jgi:hypothetical protein
MKLQSQKDMKYWSRALPVQPTYLLIAIDTTDTRRDWHTGTVKDPFTSRLGAVELS